MRRLNPLYIFRKYHALFYTDVREASYRSGGPLIAAPTQQFIEGLDQHRIAMNIEKHSHGPRLGGVLNYSTALINASCFHRGSEAVRLANTHGFVCQPPFNDLALTQDYCAWWAGRTVFLKRHMPKDPFEPGTGTAWFDDTCLELEDMSTGWLKNVSNMYHDESESFRWALIKEERLKYQDWVDNEVSAQKC